MQAERPSLRGYFDSEGDQWLLVRQSIAWSRIAEGEHGFTVVLRNEEASFHRNRLRAGPDESVYLGYPVEVIRPKDKDAWLVPMFVQPFRAKVTQGLMHLEPAGPLTVNGAWLEGRFQRSEDRDGFLRAIGLLTDADEDGAEAVASDVGLTARPNSFEDLALRSLDFVGDRVAEPIRPGSLNVGAIDRAPRVGIHNRAVLVMGPRLTYTKGLIRELAAVSRWTDQDLDRTSLSWVFPHDPSPDVGPSWPVPQPPSDLKPEMIGALNVLGRTQRDATRAALTLPGFVVTGPPGTGKSELVATILMNQILRGRSALFASKSHAVARARVGAACWTLDHGRLRATKGWRTAAELGRDLPRADSLVDREVFYVAACTAMEEAARGLTDVRAVRKARREALFATLVRFGLAIRHVGRRPRVRPGPGACSATRPGVECPRAGA